MGRIGDSLATVAFFLVALPVAMVMTASALARDLAVSLRNIWSKP